MQGLNRRALLGLLFVLLVMAALLFLAAGTFHYWQAWTFLAVFGLSALAITLYLMRNDPELLERRVYAGPTAEKETSQKLIQTITSLIFIAIMVVSALDVRFAWSRVPVYLAVAGDVLVALGFLITFFVYRENPFASATVQIYPEQKVITTGLYATVRHPMYTGGLLMILGMPLALGSWWALLGAPLFMPAGIWRIFEEEKLLTKSLSGYAEYKERVKYRLLPFVW